MEELILRRENLINEQHYLAKQVDEIELRIYIYRILTILQREKSIIIPEIHDINKYIDLSMYKISNISMSGLYLSKHNLFEHIQYYKDKFITLIEFNVDYNDLNKDDDVDPYDFGNACLLDLGFMRNDSCIYNNINKYNIKQMTYIDKDTDNFLFNKYSLQSIYTNYHGLCEIDDYKYHVKLCSFEALKLTKK